MNRDVTIRDVAKEAGVSVCCVSWVLRDHPRCSEIGEKTRQRVLETAEKLGYRRNQLAYATRTGHINTIAVILDFNRLRNFSPLNQIIAGIMMETTSRSYSVKIFPDSDLENSFRSIVENRIGKMISMSVYLPSAPPNWLKNILWSWFMPMNTGTASFPRSMWTMLK